MSDATPLTEAEHTARVVSGFLYADGTGELDPSFEIPGDAELPSFDGDAEGTRQATLRVEYDDRTASLPVGVSFDPPHVNATFEKQPFTVRIPDDGEVTAITLADADTGEELDEYRDTGWELESATVGTPGSFTREEAQPIRVDVDAHADVPLHRQLFYSPDGEHWHPYANRFTDGPPDIRFTREAGGVKAQFMLLVSDGVRTESVLSDPFELPALGPTVEIPRSVRTVTETTSEDGDGENTATDTGGVAVGVDAETRTVDQQLTTAVGDPMSVKVRARDERGRDLSPTDIVWSLTEQDGESVEITGQSVGFTVTHQFQTPGTYLFEVRGMDPRTGMEATDSVELVVDPPPLPDAATLSDGPPDGDTSQTTADDGATVPDVDVTTPGFGMTGALAALGTVGYLIRERFGGTDEE